MALQLADSPTLHPTMTRQLSGLLSTEYTNRRFDRSRRTKVTFSSYRYLIRRSDSSGCTVTRVQVRGESCFPFTEHSDRLGGATNLLQRVLGPISVEVKWPGLEAGHSPPCRVGVESVGQRRRGEVNIINHLALVLNIYSSAHHLCKM